MAAKTLSPVPSQNQTTYSFGEITLAASQVRRMLQIANQLRPNKRTTVRSLKAVTL